MNWLDDRGDNYVEPKSNQQRPDGNCDVAYVEFPGDYPGYAERLEQGDCDES